MLRYTPAKVYTAVERNSSIQIRSSTDEVDVSASLPSEESVARVTPLDGGWVDASSVPNALGKVLASNGWIVTYLKCRVGDAGKLGRVPASHNQRFVSVFSMYGLTFIDSGFVSDNDSWRW